MRTLAVTGGIGSGKSYVVRMFAALGIPVYDADLRTKRLYDEDRGLLGALQALLGPGLVKDGRLDRQYMAGRIFSDRCLLEKVEALVFPDHGVGCISGKTCACRYGGQGPYGRVSAGY